MPPLEVLPQQPQLHWAPHWAAEVRLARQVRLAEVVLPRWPPVAVARQPARAQGPRQVPAHRQLLVEAQVPPLDWPGRQTPGRRRILQQAEAVTQAQERPMGRRLVRPQELVREQRQVLELVLERRQELGPREPEPEQLVPEQLWVPVLQQRLGPLLGQPSFWEPKQQRLRPPRLQWCSIQPSA